MPGKLHPSCAVVLLTWALLSVAAQVSAQLPLCTPPPSGMVAWWPGDGDTNDIAGLNHGTLVGGVTFSPGMVDQAFSLDGATGFVEVPDAATLDLVAEITIDAWLNPTVLGGRIVDKITAGGGDGYLLDTFGDRVRMIVDGQSLSGASILPTGAWTHVAGVFDGSEMRVYVNGVLDGTLAATTAIPSNALDLRIGADSTGGNLFFGMIDEIEVIGRALSQAEIQSIVASGSAGKCKEGAPTPTPVPTSSATGLLIFVGLLVGASFMLLRSRQV